MLSVLHMERQSRLELIHEYQADQQSIWSSVDMATERGDLDRLIHLDRRYGDAVPALRNKLREAMANVSATETLREIAAARRLDLERHGREMSGRPDPMSPQLPVAETATQRLSILPR